jgi:hypothetical protein
MVTLKIRSLAISPSLILTLLLSPTIALSAESNYPNIPNKAFTAEPTKDLPQNLDDVFIFPTKSSIKFDFALWKERVGSRVYMLFDLYHQPLNEYRAEKVYDMLGKPNELVPASPSSTTESATYDLGFLNGSRAMLEVHFREGKVIWLSLKRKSGIFAPRAEEIWQRKNMNWVTFAEELNRELFIVGAPVRFLHAALGYRKLAVVDSSRKQRIGDVEFETSDDGLKVKQIRFYYHNREGLEEPTPWESADRRKAVTCDPRFLSRESEIHNFQYHRSIYLHPFIPFSSDKWKNCEPAYLGFRLAMIPPLVRNYPLIGMSRIEVHQLLGESGVSKKDVFSENDSLETISEVLSSASEVTTDIEAYIMSPPHCGSAGSHSFELKFKDDHVVGYRVHYSGGCNFDWGSSCGALFGFPDNSVVGH